VSIFCNHFRCYFTRVPNSIHAMEIP
jgi:hypothetical protein